MFKPSKKMQCKTRTVCNCSTPTLDFLENLCLHEKNFHMVSLYKLDIPKIIYWSIINHGIPHRDHSFRAYRNSWTLDARVGLWTLYAILWTLDSGPWTLHWGSYAPDTKHSCRLVQNKIRTQFLVLLIL